MKDARKEDDYQKKWEATIKEISDRRERGGAANAACLRFSNNRYAKDATFEDRLTLDDEQLLKEMGIRL